MPSLSISSSKYSGFTLVEMLVVAPIVILVIGIFVGYILSITGDGLQTRQKNSLVYNTQASLDDIETLGTRAVAFPNTTGSLPYPQGSDDNSAAFTASRGGNTLILRAAATDKNPLDPARATIFTGSGTCNPFNPVYTYMAVFFVNNSSLYKRTLLSNSTAACATPYQRGSCSPAVMSQDTPPTNCRAEDEKLMDNVSSMTVNYYNGANSSTDVDPAAADTVDVTITSGKLSAGKQISYSAALRFTTINANADVGQAPQKLSARESITSSDPDTLTCNWDSAGNAKYTYTLTSGSTTLASKSAVTDTSVSVNIAQYRGQTINCAVTADTGYSTITYDPVAFTVPIWTDCGLQNGWQNYGYGYATAQFYKTSSGLVILKGLVRGGSTTVGSKICQLPSGYRPSEGQLIFVNAGGASGAARIDVATDGSVLYYSGNNEYISLTNINFQTNASWNSLPASNGWQAYQGGYASPAVSKDNLGRVHLQGLSKGGTTTDNTVMYTMPSDYASDSYSHIPAMSGPNFTPTSTGISGTNIFVKGASGSSSYHSLQAIIYPSGSINWNSATLQNNWQNYDTSRFVSARYTKGSDNIVSLEGLIRAGTVTSGTTILTLPQGYRPSETDICAATSVNTYARLDVQTNGNVVTRDNVSATWLSLDGCDFLAG